MAAERSAVSALTDAELDELARRLCAVLHSAYLRQQATRNAAGRAPQQQNARPPAGRDERGGNGTGSTPRVSH